MSGQVLARYECKYLVDPLIVPELRQFVRAFARPDAYAARSPEYRYTISSLYLDTEDLRMYLQTVGGDKNRFKLRIRCYSDDARSPVFLEIKRRVSSIVQKRRARLSREQLRLYLARGVNGWMSGLAEPILAEVEAFGSHSHLTAAKPVMKVKYQREAYETGGGDGVRVTFDTGLQHAVTLDHDLSLSGGRWVSTPVEGTIFEIKFTERFPAWVSDLVRAFGLKQQSVPKYVMSVDHLFLQGRESALTLGGFTMPPRRS